jgi:hypothetical protein
VRISPRALRVSGRAFSVLFLAALSACTTVDPGANFVVPDQQFSSNYFYCVVEPQIVLNPMYNCGGKQANCHYSGTVPGMPLIMHAPVTCANGAPDDTPTGAAATGAGSPAESNYEQVSLYMDSDYMNAQIYLRPTQIATHPIMLFQPNPSDPAVVIIQNWAGMVQ